MSAERAQILQDIIKEAQSIKEFIKGYSLEDYLNDKKTRYAVERCFAVIGEALVRLERLDPNCVLAIRDYRKIRSFRNLLIHAYEHVDSKIVWGVLGKDLDYLIEDIEALQEN